MITRRSKHEINITPTISFREFESAVQPTPFTDTRNFHNAAYYPVDVAECAKKVSLSDVVSTTEVAKHGGIIKSLLGSSSNETPYFKFTITTTTDVIHIKVLSFIWNPFHLKWFIYRLLTNGRPMMPQKEEDTNLAATLNLRELVVNG